MILSNGLQNAKRYFKTISCLFRFSYSSLKAVKKFCLFADEKLPKLKNKNYFDYKLEPGEWEILDLVQEVLAVHDSVLLIKFYGSHEIRNPVRPKLPFRQRLSQHFGAQFLIWNCSNTAGRLC
jgi:hypothetical protein